MDIKEQLKDIKTQLRLSMNGAVSQSIKRRKKKGNTASCSDPSQAVSK